MIIFFLCFPEYNLTGTDEYRDQVTFHTTSVLYTWLKTWHNIYIHNEVSLADASLSIKLMTMLFLDPLVLFPNGCDKQMKSSPSDNLILLAHC